jgi:hypothetical protein
VLELYPNYPRADVSYLMGEVFDSVNGLTCSYCIPLLTVVLPVALLMLLRLIAFSLCIFYE